MADPIGRVISKIHDAALDPRLWSSVLQSVTEAIGAVGAAYIVRNARTGRVDWANFLGPSAKYTSDYIARFAAQDRFMERLTNHEGTWMRLSEQLPATELRAERMVYRLRPEKRGERHRRGASQRYGIAQSDFRRSRGNWRQAASSREPQASGSIAGADSQGGRGSTPAPRARMEIGCPGSRVRSGLDRRHRRRRLWLGHRDERTGRAGRPAWRRPRAPQWRARRGAGLRDRETWQAAITSATRPGPAAASSRILIGRHRSKHDYILAVSPLGVDLGFYSDPMALIIVVDPEARSPKADDLSAYFGLSFAEAGLRRSSCRARR